MEVTSYAFFLFFPIVVLTYYVIPKVLRQLWLLVVSYYFYMSWNVKYGIVLLTITIITYLGALALKWIDGCSAADRIKIRMKKSSIAVLALVIFGMLSSCKYFIFVAGISFYSLQSFGYIMDVYHGKAETERNFLRYALFLSFFPTVVSGPIERSTSFLRQLRYEDRTSFRMENIKQGLCMMMWGYFLKLVVAERSAIFVNAVFDQNPGGVCVILAVLLYGMQIYCDFAGYSTLAVGAGRVLGFTLTENFDAPYLSATVSEFWRKWHRSLTGWFRDYLYIPLGGNRKGQVRKYINIMIVFVASGIWHGSGWKYLIWGGLNGSYQIVGEVLAPIRKKIADGLRLGRIGKIHRILQVAGTYVLVDFAWLFFRANDTQSALSMIKGAITEFRLSAIWDGSIYAYGLGQTEFHFLLVTILTVTVVDYLHYHRRYILELIKQWHWTVRVSLCACMFMSIIMFGVYGVNYDVGSFIYFTF